jgi:AF2212-like
MTKTLRAVFDGQVLRPIEPANLEPNKEYVVTVEEGQPGTNGLPYPLSTIRALATDMGVTDLSTRHDHYAHGKIEDHDRGS